MDARNGYPDMNIIFFKGIPKLMQVADDMHRMADYVSDFRTITYAGIVFSIIGALVFLIVKYRNKQNKPVPRGGEPSRQFQRYGGCQTYPWNGRDGVVIGVESPSFGSTRASDYTDMDGVPANCENARNNNAYYKGTVPNPVVE